MTMFWRRAISAVFVLLMAVAISLNVFAGVPFTRDPAFWAAGVVAIVWWASSRKQ